MEKHPKGEKKRHPIRKSTANMTDKWLIVHGS